MANDLNRVMMVGRLVKDPEKRDLSSGTSVASFTIANNRSYVKNGEKSEQVSYFECIAWGKLAEMISQYCKKGKLIGIDGRLQQRSWDDNDGKKRYKTEIVVENIQFLSGNKQETNNEPVKGFEQQHNISDADIPDADIPF